MAADMFATSVTELGLASTAVLAAGLAGIGVYLIPRAIAWAKAAM